MKTKLRSRSWARHRLVCWVAGLLALSALVWWGGPLVAFKLPGDEGPALRPLASLLSRSLTVALLALGCTACMGWVWWQRRRAHAALLKGMEAGRSVVDGEEATLQARFDEALALLRRAPGQRHARRPRWWPQAMSLYELPWYVFVGAPGSGKTTALLNAGLHFPLAEQMGQASVRGVGGTRDCEWWFTDEAVLIDTAGRYATQDSDQGIDAAGWRTFLKLLRQARPRRPINGVLLTVSVHDLLTTTTGQRQAQAARLRGRLQELQEQLGVKAPVYVLVTKCDLLAGFNETFGAMGEAERAQVFGVTFDARQGIDGLTGLASEFNALQERLQSRVIERMEAEADVLWRAAVFGFPQQLAGLQSLLRSFLEAVFGGTGRLDERPALRGVYLTSGTQEGTPIDRVLGRLARSFGLENCLDAASALGRGRSYFLRRLLPEVVFAERGLVGFNEKVERRRARWRLAGFAGLGIVFAGLLMAWTLSYVANQRYVEQVAAGVPALRRALQELPFSGAGSDVSSLPGPLARLRDAARPPGFALDAVPLSLGWGLFQGDKLDAAARAAYERLLDRMLAPRVARRLEERLRTAQRDNLEYAYEALKAYLMMHAPEHRDVDTLKAWVALDWDTQLQPMLGAEALASLKNHFDALLALNAAPAGVPLDEPLVASVREMLGAFPLEYRVYSRLKRAGLGQDLPEFSVAAAAGPQSPNVFERASGLPLTRGIPGLFTRAGYHQAFQPAVEESTRQLADEEAWIFGGQNAARARRAASDPGLADRVRRLYLEEYVKLWDAYLADLRLVKLAGLDRSVAVARLLSSVDSPLAAFLRAAAKETTLVDNTPKKPGFKAGALEFAQEEAREEMTQTQRELAGLVGMNGHHTETKSQGVGHKPIEQFVDDHFARLHQLVQGQPAPIDDVLKMFNEVYVQLSAVDAAQKTKAPPPVGGGARVKAAAAQQPEPVRTLLEGLADAADQQTRSVERQSLTGELQPIAEFCSRAVAGRYPLANGAQTDILPEDFGQFFGPGGMLDDFFQRRLAPLVDVSAAAWRFRPIGDGARPVKPAALADFQRAARVREVFFRSGGKVPALRLDIHALELAEDLEELSIDVDGQVFRFTRGGTGPALSLQWPGARLSSQIRLRATPGGPPMVFDGPWALFRLFDRFEVQSVPQQPERFIVLMNVDGHRARLAVTASTVFNPFRMRELQQFRCPGAL